MIDSSSGQDQVYYLEVDSLNTPRTARDQTGTIVWQWYSDAFGSTLPNEDPDGNGILTHINLRFPGQYYDPETGLHYNMARYYNPGIGRYLQSDPIGLAGGLNDYAYVSNNPLRLFDPLGLYETSGCSITKCALIAKAIANAQNAANKQGIGPDFSKTLETTNFICKKPEKNKDYCGANKDPDIYLRNAFDPNKCGSLASTLLHEVSHSKPLNYTEMDAFILEYKTFGSKIPTPEQLRSQYEQLSDEQIRYYTEQYNKVMQK